ncbi:MAG: hypothetical protein UX85_C0001G0236 [Candidatus Beckwithbacteria bacterium GW2011_GWB1_47_15]|uniref:LUD domain-containing protein n=1 Tax=Candidatus Beckwithbacteria bacterium GW2011_GWB1_47_15 TaxID=1618371 RepID=A0A0G1RY38_9BACT|nr:MAG: hypothetical protein UY43_C0001G0889 [Candidatus Beckwithbacteria bacterium GW2011_GWC1_49_16]AQS30874.1 hypothetical protein [uncultured bacterium]KKU36058.1 MAG: hypothetical protein UX50_C0001G0235 [Candidatus Beckwithbacteria bacterium GW2011_GWA1_46_30]KKU62022.1 MAG: hypothetical protein UX85_C0001G0236 [Candidatus Beckwithbacteria bacterium GW2011_GWB1_47_15]KKU72424.1 MAG: hypothetical protein UX97_C0001G0294 [Candidatus Beckwithbacteria bacterium GW2011_GWA2_47_25]OGD49332.1 M
MPTWDQLADETTIQKTIAALKQNGINALVVDNAEAAKAKVLELVPAGAEVMNMSSTTLETLGLDKALNEPGKFNSVRNKLNQMDRVTQGLEMQKLGAAPEYAVGSVHAVTADGKVLVASNTGSQLGAYAYSSTYVIWVVGTQKLVADQEQGVKRIYDYILPLESKRVQKAYGMEKSNVSKLLIFNQETTPGRLTLIFVKEKLGF